MPTYAPTHFLCYSRDWEHVLSRLPPALPCGPAECHGIREGCFGSLPTNSSGSTGLDVAASPGGHARASLSSPFLRELGNTLTHLSLVAQEESSLSQGAVSSLPSLDP